MAKQYLPLLAASIGWIIFKTSPASALPFLGPGLDWGLVPSHLIPFLIFGFRTADKTLGTLRMLAILRGRKVTAWVIALAQSALFLTGIAGVLGSLQNVWSFVAYALGFASGNVLGIAIEAVFAPGHCLLRVISARKGTAIMETLHTEGRGATELPAQGKSGMVSVILCYVPRRQMNRVTTRVIQIDPEAFITVENVRQLRGGWKA